MSTLYSGSPTGLDGLTSANVNQLRDVLSRLAATLEEENQTLENRRELSLDGIIHKKSQLLLELMRASKNCGPDLIKRYFESDVRKFKALTQANDRLLSVHLTVAKEVSNTILEALRQNESDGTYGGSRYNVRGMQ